MTTLIDDKVHANGIDIFFREAGSGPPVVLLQGGLVSTSDLWAETPLTYTPHMAALAQHFRVIAPDTRSAGRTVHPGGSISPSLLADDVAALIAALGLDRPAVMGFSEGGLSALLLGIRHPGLTSAIVSDAGYDTLNPEAPAFGMIRPLVDGNGEVDPDVLDGAFGADPHMGPVWALMKKDADAAQGEGYWRTYAKLTFERYARFVGYTYADLASITEPTLLVVGDRDGFCSVEEAAVAYRSLAQGRLAVVPGTDHVITAEKVELATRFLQELEG